jgi:hypothetical protein
MIHGGTTTFGLGVDLAVHVVMLTVLVSVVTKLYPRIIN